MNFFLFQALKLSITLQPWHASTRSVFLSLLSWTFCTKTAYSTIAAFLFLASAWAVNFYHSRFIIIAINITWLFFFNSAHVCGFIGKNVQRGRVDTIIGLDPAGFILFCLSNFNFKVKLSGPLFSERNPGGRLDAGDANYVEAVHTNGPTLFIVGAGIGVPIAHADFFANGGTSQPG